MTTRAAANAPATARAPTVIRTCLCASIVIFGLALRRYGFALGLPSAIVKYGGSMLWGAMVFFLVAIAAPRLSRRNIALISTGIAVCVELLRLLHAPWLDQFRLTLAGALMIGRIFSVWDIVAYGVGIGLAAGLDGPAVRLFVGNPPPGAGAP